MTFRGNNTYITYLYFHYIQGPYLYEVVPSKYHRQASNGSPEVYSPT